MTFTEHTMRLRMAAKAAQNSEQDIQQETPKPIRIRKQSVFEMLCKERAGLLMMKKM